MRMATVGSAEGTGVVFVLDGEVAVLAQEVGAAERLHGVECDGGADGTVELVH